MKDELKVMWDDIKRGLRMIGTMAYHALGAVSAFLTLAGVVYFVKHGWDEVDGLWFTFLIIGLAYLFNWWRKSARTRSQLREWK